jgi:hypothetical protein
MGIIEVHPAVFVRVANKGLRTYGKWKSAEVLENKAADKRRLHAGTSEHRGKRKNLRTFPRKHAGRMRRTNEVGTWCGVYVRAESPDPQIERKRTEKTDSVGLKRLTGMAADKHAQDYHRCIGCVK